MQSAKVLFKNILRNPFRYNLKMMGVTFCIVSITNAVSLFFNKSNLEFAKQHSEVTAIAIVSKSAYYGMIWPAFYYGAIKNPSNVFGLWYGTGQLLNEIENTIPLDGNYKNDPRLNDALREIFKN